MGHRELVLALHSGAAFGFSPPKMQPFPPYGTAMGHACPQGLPAEWGQALPSVESTAAAGWGGVKPLSPGGVTAPALHRVPEVRVCWCQPCTGTVFAWGRLSPVSCRLLGARPVPPGDTAGFLGGLPISPVSCPWGCSGHTPLQQPPSTHIMGVPEPPLHGVPAVGTAAFPPLRGWPGPVPSLPHRRVLQACGTAAASAFGVGWGLGWAPLPPAAGSV